jgi:hypothetical protein
MSAVQLIQLERDVEVARARFAEDLGRLRDPRTFSALKHDLLEEARQAKDDVVAKAKEAAKEGAEHLLGQLKEKAAANPAAALAIGAGLAWRIIHKPPIASLLVGIGLVSLWRTEPQRSQPYMGIYDEDPLTRNYEQSVASRVTDLAGAAKDRVQQWTAEARDTVQETTVQLAEKAGEVADRAATVAREGVKQAADTAASAAEKATTAIYDAVPDQETRDNLLLGAAALAVATAVGIAYQRRA